MSKYSDLIKEKSDFEVEYRLLCACKKILCESNEIYNDIEDCNNIVAYERPDMVFTFENYIVGVEEFEFSAYKSSKKGDLTKRQKNIVHAENIEEHRSTGKEYFSRYIVTDMSKDYYSKNFIKAFENHYSKLEEYKNNLNLLNSNNKIYFLIKDTTIWGNEIIYNDNPIFYYPLMNKEIFDYLKDKTKIDGIIFQSETIYNNNVFFFFKPQKNNFDLIYEENKKYFNIELNKSNFTTIDSFHSFNSNE